MQYCFGGALADVVPSGTLEEQSPFSVHAMDDKSATFCWRDGLRGMPTHAVGCSGCDCAKITLTLTATDTMEFVFYQSPPVVHAHVWLKRSAPAPDMTAIASTMTDPYKQCTFKDHWGNNTAPSPNLKTTAAPGVLQSPAVRPGRGCAAGVAARHMLDKHVAGLVADQAQALAADPHAGQCHQLNGINAYLQKLTPLHHLTDTVPDVKIQFKAPTKPCSPCDVTYSVSAAIDEGQYIGVGFKGESWEGQMFDGAFCPGNCTARPCYFGESRDGSAASDTPAEQP
jgi:hypothetical protein